MIILTPNKLLTRLSIFLAQIKTGNNLYKLKNEIKQILYLLNRHNKITKKFTTISSSLYDNRRKYDCDNRSQNFLFQFWLTKRFWWEFEAWNWAYNKK